MLGVRSRRSRGTAQRDNHLTSGLLHHGIGGAPPAREGRSGRRGGSGEAAGMLLETLLVRPSLASWLAPGGSSANCFGLAPPLAGTRQYCRRQQDRIAAAAPPVRLSHCLARLTWQPLCVQAMGVPLSERVALSPRGGGEHVLWHTSTPLRMGWCRALCMYVSSGGGQSGISHGHDRPRT